jgi:ribose transport system ATP-binding protein
MTTMSPTSSDGVQLLLEARSIEKHFGRVVALREGSFQLRDNEIHAIVGDNGAGKSTLIKIVSGVLQPDGGDILLEGNPVTIGSPLDARALGIETVYQDLALANHLDAAANLFLGREELRPPPLSWFGVLDKKKMRRRAVEELSRLKIGIQSVQQPVLTMSGGQRQAIAVARATVFAGKIVMLDEPTAALGLRESRHVLDLIKELRAEGNAVILITHNMEHVVELADRAVILRQGRKVGELKPNRSNRQEMVSMIIGAA